ncbi:hypothetical protein [Rhodanobacter sp. L36]|uniref:hypothetical protein n=1 Tax=Rhodanobacter sp. L36 TaxID=1747221 RepID=UPI00131E32ED|nr:hypothetical protein [Rhodanobacter sp. L36]
MINIQSQYSPEAADHLARGRAWLTESSSGDNCAAIAYAALELRFAIERLTVSYWYSLRNQEIQARDLHEIRSFKRVEKRIYELGGHQKEINGNFEFMRIMLEALKIDRPCETPKMGEIASHWHVCSEYCHIGWPLASIAPEVKSAAFVELTEVSESLLRYVTSFGWPVFRDQATIHLRDKFVRGEISSEDVLDHFRKTGLYAVEKPAGDKVARFMGIAVPPQLEA